MFIKIDLNVLMLLGWYIKKVLCMGKKGVRRCLRCSSKLVVLFVVVLQSWHCIELLLLYQTPQTIIIFPDGV